MSKLCPKSPAFLLLALALVPAVLTAQVSWICATDSADWQPRYSFSALTFQDRMWVFGGHYSTQPGWNDVWNSDDGLDWSCVTPSAPWSGRGYHAAAVFDDRMWLLGGDDGYGGPHLLNDVWASSDGDSWELVTASAGWTPRCGHAALVFDNRLWVLGGYFGGNTTSDVWFTTNGSTWTRTVYSAPWTARNPGAVVFDNKMWVIGGGAASGELNDVWCSTDGVLWTLVADSAPWRRRAVAAVAAFREHIWLLGGYSDTVDMNDVWCSRDGLDWAMAGDSAAWQRRMTHAATVFADRLWVLGGTSFHSGDLNDVWYTSGLAVEEDVGTTVTDADTHLRAFPSPFSTQTTIRYELTREAKVTLGVFDVGGRCVQTLVNRLQPAGYHHVTWNVIGAGDHELPSGVYVCCLGAGDLVVAVKVTLQR